MSLHQCGTVPYPAPTVVQVIGVLCSHSTCRHHSPPQSVSPDSWLRVSDEVWVRLSPEFVQTKPQIIILCFALLRISRHSFIIVLVSSASPVEAGHSRTRAVTGHRGISQYPEMAPVRAFSLLVVRAFFRHCEISRSAVASSNGHICHPGLLAAS